MNWQNTILLLATAFVAVFLQSWVRLVRNVLGVQPDILPALMVYAALTAGLATVSLLAVFAGLCFDALSANPPGTTILPLFLAGFAVHHWRDLVLRYQPQAQFLLGAAAGAAVPFLALVLLLVSGGNPLIDLWSLWQWFALALSAGLFTPVVFAFFDRLNRAFNYRSAAEPSFRPDREIKRDRIPRAHS